MGIVSCFLFLVSLDHISWSQFPIFEFELFIYANLEQVYSLSFPYLLISSLYLLFHESETKN